MSWVAGRICFNRWAIERLRRQSPELSSKMSCKQGVNMFRVLRHSIHSQLIRNLGTWAMMKAVNTSENSSWITCTKPWDVWLSPFSHSFSCPSICQQDLPIHPYWKPAVGSPFKSKFHSMQSSLGPRKILPPSWARKPSLLFRWPQKEIGIGT